MIYPKGLKTNDTIEIVSPSNGIKTKKIHELESAIKYLEDKGYKVIEDKNVRSSFNGESANKELRAKELNDAITNKNVNSIIACSGGDFIVEILDLLKFNKLKNNIKWIQGQSDITALLYYITTKFDIATIYSFNVRRFGENYLPNSMKENNLAFLCNKPVVQSDFCYKFEKDAVFSNWECITNFKNVEGRIIGGCLDSLKDIIGTKYDKTKNFIDRYFYDGIIWYFDIAEMTNEGVTRTLWQLKHNNWFDNCKCILFGRVYEEKTFTDISLRDSILKILSDVDIPIIINADLGHTNPVITIINGSYVKIKNCNKYVIETIYK